MPQSFSLKTIRVTVTLGKGVFSEGGNTKIIEGLACEASITKPGLPEQNSASVKLWGLSYDTMAQLTTLSFRPLESHRNVITIEAGDQGSSLPLVFKGNITSASADFNQAPDPVMQFEAASGYFAQQIAKPMHTVKGEASAAQLVRGWASDAGFTFQNQGVTALVRNACYPGDPVSKIKKIAHDIGCELIIDDEAVIIMPAGEARKDTPSNGSGGGNSTAGGGNAVLLTKDTGMIGYPTFSQSGISCKCVFNPAIRYGGLIKVESIVPKATGTWIVTKLTHSIAAYAPGGGNWETQIEAARRGGIYG